MWRHQWITPVILDTQEAEIRRITVQSQLGTPPTTGVGGDAGKKEPSYTVGGNVD
jgi:hypothetical protein